MNDDASPSPIERVIAVTEIRDLASRYASAIEARDVDAMIDLFAPHARFGRYGEGPEALRRLMEATMEGSVFAVILVANHLIELESPDRARGEVWAHCYAQTAAEGFVEQLIKYEDRYVLVDGMWRFLRRRHGLWYGVAHRESPLRQGAANWPERQVGIGDVPLADPEFVRWWERQR